MADGGISALTIASLALTAVGTGVGVATTIAQADQQQKMEEYNMRVSENNAKAATDQAAYEAERTREKGLRILGSQRAAYGAMGIDLTGSAADVGLDSSISNELDALAMEYQGKIGSGRYQAQAGLQAAGARNAAAGGRMAAVGTVLTGASRGVSLMGDVPGFG